MSETTNTDLQKSFNHPTGDGVPVSGGIGGAVAQGRKSPGRRPG
jgi:hypothetical protein